MSPRPCRSANRCSDLHCPGCVWRYARSVTCRILTQSTGPLHTVTICETSAFRVWRVEARNRIDYLRRVDPLWREFGVWGWLQRDANMKGIVSLGALGPDEVTKGLVRWSPQIGPEVRPDGLRGAVWSVIKPSQIPADVGGARYQGLKLNIWPRREPARSSTSRQSSRSCQVCDPMPVVI